MKPVQYVKSQLAVGHSSTEIRDALINAGWNLFDIDQVIPAPFKSPTIPPQEEATIASSPEMTKPFPVNLISQTVQNPEQPTTSTPMEKPKKSHILPIILAFLGIGIIAGSGLYLYQKMYLKPAPSVTVATPQPSPVATQPINTLTTFSDFGVTFSYPSAWQRIRMSTLTESLLNGNVNFATPSASKTPEVVYLFFTPDEYSQLLSLSQSYRQDLAASKNQASASATTSALGNFVGLTTKAARLSELTITHLDGANALTSAQDLSKGQCSGTNISYSTSSPVDNSRIQSATVSGQLAYYLPPQSGCSYQNTTVIIDCGNMAKPASCEFAFNNAPDINHLSPDQEALLQSIKIQ